jgi:hypothetical protein
MKEQKQAAKLVRQRAEETLKAKRKVIENPDQGLPSLVHELQVHREELTIQNGEVRQAQIEIERWSKRLVDCITSPDRFNFNE